MRVFISGLVGAAASSFLWFYLQHTTHEELGWLAIGVGIVTGLCVNAAAGASAKESVGRAVLAVVLTLVGVVGGRAVYAEVMKKVTVENAEVTEPAEEDATPEGATKEGADEDTIEEPTQDDTAEEAAAPEGEPADEVDPEQQAAADEEDAEAGNRLGILADRRVMPGDVDPTNTPSLLQQPGANTASMLDMVWMGVASLAAYLLGKGRSAAAVSTGDAAPEA